MKENRTIYIPVKMTVEENQKLEFIMKKMSRTRSDAVRQCIIEKYNQLSQSEEGKA